MQLEMEKDDLKKKMEENEQLEIKNRNFSCFRCCIVVFALLGLLFVSKYSMM